MSHVEILNKPIRKLISNDCGVVLDVGCGYGDFGFLVKTRKSCKFLIGIDVWKPYLDELSDLGVYDKLIEAKVPPIPLENKSVDTCLACEILEHLPKEVGTTFLSELERVTKNSIIISTLINYPQDTVDVNPYQKRLSEWNKKELEDRGYEVQIVKTLPKTLKIVDRLGRFVFGLSVAPIFIVAHKNMEKKFPLTIGSEESMLLDFLPKCMQTDNGNHC